MKRAYADSDQEDEVTERYIDNEEDETKARKRRRGLIEKKRRDRINRCLTELRRLVPAAVDKQGSAKLEKAEILQLTVDHLRNLRNISKNERVVLGTADFRMVGYRECLNEVTSYLYKFQDPNYKNEQKGQLLSHLNTIISHRPNTSSHISPPAQAMWPLQRGIEASQTSRYEGTFLPLNVSNKQQNQNTGEKSTTLNINGVTLAPEPKQIASQCHLFPIDTTIRMVGYPYTPH